MPSSTFNKYRLKGAYHYDWYKTESWYKKLIDRAAKFCKGSTLDYGCGDGLLLSILTNRGYDVAGYDTDPDAIRLAKQKVPTADFYSDLLPMRPFEYLACLNVIEHLDDPDILRRLIDGDGITEGAIISTIDYQGGSLGEDHKKEYTMDELMEFFKKYNPRPFRIEDIWIGIEIRK